MHRILTTAFLLAMPTLGLRAQTQEPMTYRITVPAGADLTLEGTLTLPENMKPPVPVVLLIAGSGPTDRNGNSTYGLKADVYKMLADSLVRKGIAVARYDKRGSGTNLKAAATTLKSEEHRFDFYVSDAVGLIRQLQADKRFSGVTVAGHSEGSLVGMLAAEQAKAARFISLEGAGRNIADVLKEQFETAILMDTLRQVANRDIDTLRAGQRLKYINPLLMGMFSPAGQAYFISWMKYDPALVVRSFKGPVLIVQGRHDIQVSMTDAELLKKARPDAKLAVFDQMNHILKNAPAVRAENIKTYNDPTLPLTPGLTDTIAQFVK